MPPLPADAPRVTQIGDGAIVLFSIFSIALIACISLMIFWCWWRLNREEPYADVKVRLAALPHMHGAHAHSPLTPHLGHLSSLLALMHAAHAFSCGWCSRERR